MKTYLFMVNGPEQRDFLVEQTINRCEKYFDSIRIIQNGVSNKEPSKLIRQYTIKTYDIFVPFTEACQYFLDSIHLNDWFLHTDSDECPNKSLLEFIQNRDFGDVNTYLISFMHHCIKDHAVTALLDGGEYFRPARLIKKEVFTRPSSYMNLHYGFVHDILLDKHVPEHKMNHYKDYIATGLSTMSHYVQYPTSFAQDFIIDAMTKLKDSIPGFNTSTPYSNFENKQFWRHVLSMIAEFKDSVNDSPENFKKEFYKLVDSIYKSNETLENLYQYTCNCKDCQY